MADISLHSDSIQLRVDPDLASQLIDPELPHVLRAAPGVRGADLPEIASCLYITTSAGASLMTLILAKGQVKAFAERLWSVMRDSGDSIELSTNINGTKASVKITAADTDTKLTRTLSALVDALASEAEAAEDE